MKAGDDLKTAMLLAIAPLTWAALAAAKPLLVVHVDSMSSCPRCVVVSRKLLAMGQTVILTTTPRQRCAVYPMVHYWAGPADNGERVLAGKCT